MAIYQLKRNSLADQIVNEDKLANGSVLPQHINASVDTDVIAEGDNLYFTNTRAIYALTAGTNMIIDSNGLITANVESGGASVSVANAAPEGATEGDMYWDEELGRLFVYYTDGDSSQWVEASPASTLSNSQIIAALTAGTNMIIDSNGLITANVSGGGASVTIANAAPAGATEGDLYWDEDLGKLFIYYVDEDSSQWVDVSTKVANVVSSGGGASVTVSNTAPESATEGDLYWDSDLGKLFVYYSDSDTTQWVEASPIPTVPLTNAQIVSAFTANENMSIAANGLITANVVASTGAVPLPHPFLLAGM